MTGTIVNTLAVIAGSSIGLLVNLKLPEKITKTAFQAIGLFTIYFGISMALKTNELILVIFSLLIGSIIGEWIDLEKLLSNFSEQLKAKLKFKNEKFTEGFITSFLLFCMGSMTILGAIDEGINHNPDILLAKSTLDGFSSIALAASLGIGVMFSAIPLLIYQGTLTVLAAYFGHFFSSVMINEITATGGILLLGLGISILEIKKIKILNMIPSLIIIVFLVWIFV
ncbi:MAG: DUF554 domain-containing protein [Chlorobi bacterium]|nr:DUF554 domain-containing protein [Chlorobiota bacterium]